MRLQWHSYLNGGIAVVFGAANRSSVCPGANNNSGSFAHQTYLATTSFGNRVNNYQGQNNAVCRWLALKMRVEENEARSRAIEGVPTNVGAT